MSLDALSRLCLIRVKVERAKKHLRNLEPELLAFRDGEQTVTVAEFDPKAEPPFGFDKVHIIGSIPQLPFDAIPAAGDIIHNLRSALDHLAYQFVLVGTNGAGPPKPTAIQFPIAEDRVAYESRKARQVEGMRSEAKLAIDSAQPYKGGNEILWRIHDLDNADKHHPVYGWA